MSISNLQNNSTSSAQDILGRSLERVARQLPKTEFFDALSVSGKFDTQRQQVESDLADVQNATTAAQSSRSVLGDVADLLDQMGDLAKNSKANDATAQAQFSALQDQLRSALNSGGDDQASLGLKSLVAQDSKGNYLVTLSSGDLSNKLAAAGKDLATGQSANAEHLAHLNRRGAALQVESANLNSTLQQLKTEDDAASATEWVKASIFAQPAAALSTQAAGRSQGAVNKLLQD